MNKIRLFILTILIFIINANETYAIEHPYFIRSISRSPDSKYIAIGRLDGKIILFNREKMEILKVIESKTKQLNWDVAFTTNSKYFVFQDADLYVNIYDIENDEITKKVKIDDNYDSIAFIGDMEKLIWGGKKGKIEVVDLETLEKIILKSEHPYPECFESSISSIIVSPDNKYFVTVTFSNSSHLNFKELDEDIRSGINLEDLHSWDIKYLGVNLWNIKTYKKLKTLNAEYLDGRTWVSFSKDGQYLLVTSENGITVWDSHSFKLLNQNHMLNNGCGFVDVHNQHFVVLWTNPPGAGLYLLKNFIKEKEPYHMKALNFKYKPCTGAIVTDPEKYLIIVGDMDGSISVYRFNPDDREIHLEWHPKPIAPKVIEALNPFCIMFRRPELLEYIKNQYKVSQLRINDEESKKGIVETKYETIQIPEDKEKEQKSPVVPLTLVK